METAKEYKSFLIIKMSSLGDIIHALPTLAAIRQNWPKAKITWAVHPQYADCIPMNPYVDELIIVDRKKLFTISYMYKLYQEFHKHSFDIVIDLQCLLKSNIINLLCGCSNRYGFCEQKELSFLFTKRLVGPYAHGNIVERYLDTVRMLGGKIDKITFPSLPIDKEREAVKRLLAIEEVRNKYIVFAVSTRWENKNWPTEHFATLGNYLTKEGYDILLIGTKEDNERGQAIIEGMNGHGVYSFLGKTNLKELYALIEGARLFIGGDTGPMHMANACQIPLIALFGATYPSRSGPYGNARAHVILSPKAPEERGKRTNDVKAVMSYLTPQMVIDEYEMMKRNGELIE